MFLSHFFEPMEILADVICLLFVMADDIAIVACIYAIVFIYENWHHTI